MTQDGGFILCTFFAMAGLKCTQLCSSDFTKTLYLAYYWGCEGLCLGACGRMFRTDRVYLWWLLGRVAAMYF